MKNKNRKFLLSLVLAIILIFARTSFADEIYSIDISADIDENGIAHVTEVWKTNEDSFDATEKYKVISDLNGIKIRDFKVSRNGEDFTEIYPWDLDLSFDEKKNHYGMIQKENGVELCWGITEFGENTYTLTYTIDPIVVGLNDYDMVYYRFIKENLEPLPDSISMTINSYKPFADETSLWAFGFKGNIENKDGKIIAKSTGDVNYGLVMLRMPKGTFATSLKIDQDFDYYKEMAIANSDFENNSYDNSSDGEIPDYDQDTSDYYEDEDFDGDFNAYDYFDQGPSFWDFGRFFSILPILFSALTVGIFIKNKNESDSFRPINKEVLKNPKEFKEEYFREIPYQGPIEDTYLINLYAYKSNSFENYMNAFLLKWVYQGVVEFAEEDEKILFMTHTVSYIKLIQKPEDMSLVESSFYDILQECETYTDDGKITQKEIEEYVRDHQRIPEVLSKKLSKNSLDKLCQGQYLSNEKTKKKFAFSNDSYNNNVKIEEKGIELYENFIKFKNYLADYSLIKERDINEVKLWDSFMIYAAIYGISKEVYKNFTEIYPEYEKMSYFDYYMIANINSYSHFVSQSFNNAANNFENSSHGGFSSFSGGGGSFGGGSGGSGGGSR